MRFVLGASLVAVFLSVATESSACKCIVREGDVWNSDAVVFYGRALETRPSGRIFHGPDDGVSLTDEQRVQERAIQETSQVTRYLVEVSNHLAPDSEVFVFSEPPFLCGGVSLPVGTDGYLVAARIGPYLASRSCGNSLETESRQLLERHATDKLGRPLAIAPQAAASDCERPTLGEAIGQADAVGWYTSSPQMVGSRACWDRETDMVLQAVIPKVSWKGPSRSEWMVARWRALELQPRRAGELWWPAARFLRRVGVREDGIGEFAEDECLSPPAPGEPGGPTEEALEAVPWRRQETGPRPGDPTQATSPTDALRDDRSGPLR